MGSAASLVTAKRLNVELARGLQRQSLRSSPPPILELRYKEATQDLYRPPNEGEAERPIAGSPACASLSGKRTAANGQTLRANTFGLGGPRHRLSRPPRTRSKSRAFW